MKGNMSAKGRQIDKKKSSDANHDVAGEIPYGLALGQRSRSQKLQTRKHGKIKKEKIFETTYFTRLPRD